MHSETTYSLLSSVGTSRERELETEIKKLKKLKLKKPPKTTPKSSPEGFLNYNNLMQDGLLLF